MRNEVIIGDTDVLKTAPYRMTIAGFADLIGKLNALNDWRLEVLITGAHYCKKIDELVTAYVDDILTKISSCKHQSNKKLQTELIWDGPRGDNWVPPIAKKVRKIRLFGDYIRLK